MRIMTLLCLAIALNSLLTMPSRAEEPPSFLLKFGAQANPTGLGIDDAGNVYITDFFGAVLKFSNDGVLLGKWGTQGADPGQFIYPSDVAVAQDGTIYVSEYGNRRVQVFDPSFSFLRQWSTYYIDPVAIAVDSNAGLV